MGTQMSLLIGEGELWLYLHKVGHPYKYTFICITYLEGQVYFVLTCTTAYVNTFERIASLRFRFLEEVPLLIISISHSNHGHVAALFAVHCSCFLRVSDSAVFMVT